MRALPALRAARAAIVPVSAGPRPPAGGFAPAPPAGGFARAVCSGGQQAHLPAARACHAGVVRDDHDRLPLPVEHVD